MGHGFAYRCGFCHNDAVHAEPGRLYEHAAGLLGGSLTNGARWGVLFLTMTDDESSVSDCIECKQQLTEIDNRGTRLSGCMNCNIWWSLSGAKVRISEEVLHALHDL